MPRTTITIDDNLFHTLRNRSAQNHKSLKDYINELLGWALEQTKKNGSFKLKWSTVKGNKAPAVSIDDRDRLYDFLDKN